MYKVTNLETGEKKEYSDLEDFLDDIKTDETIIEWLDEIYPSVEVPFIGEIPSGELIYKLTNWNKNDKSVDWNVLEESWMDMETEFIQSELSYGVDEMDYGCYRINEISE